MNTKYIFIADGELKVFLSELIAQQYCQDGEHHFFAFTPKIQDTWNLYPWKTRTLLPWVHKQGVFKKYWNLRGRLHYNLQKFGDVCEGADRIIFHTYQLFSERTNYLYHYLSRRFPKAQVLFRLIPDGTLNLKRRPLGIRSLSQWINWTKWLGDPHLHPYFYTGDRLGAEAPICDRIYLPEGFPNEYDPAKVHWIRMPHQKAQSAGGPKRALVVGTALTQTEVCNLSDMQQMARAIHDYIAAQGITEVHYKMHHKERADQKELWTDGYHLLNTSRGIERILLSDPYDLLIGTCSTALLTSRLMFAELPVVCAGLDIVEKRSRRGSSVLQYRKTCENLRIELVPALPGSRSTATVRRAA